MSLPAAIAQTVDSIVGVISPDHMSERDLQALANTLRATLRAVDDELLARIATRSGRLPVSYPWPDEAEVDTARHPLVRRALADFPKGSCR